MKTSKNLKQLSIMDELTSSQGDSLASPSPMQGKGKAHKMTVTSGLKCLESYERFPHHSSWVRMFVASLIGVAQMENPIWYSTRCALTWKLRGTKSHRLYFQLAVKTLPTDETAFGLLPTPQTVNREKTEEQARERHEKYGGTTRGLYLTNQAAMGMLPTPTTSCQNAGTAVERTDGVSRRSELNHLVSQEAGISSQLNPLFVEEMMGFPKGWTLSPFQNGEEKP